MKKLEDGEKVSLSIIAAIMLLLAYSNAIMYLLKMEYITNLIFNILITIGVLLIIFGIPLLIPIAKPAK